MANKISHKNNLNNFFLKVLTVQKSIEAINNNWLATINLSIANHHFTDPINYVIQDDKNQIEHFNRLFNTDYTEIKWANKIFSNSQITINDDNKTNISNEFLSNIYCQLSVTLFEHLCVLLKDLSSSKKRINFAVINDFDACFRSELLEIDQKKIVKTPTILILHNLRLFRNCITHSGGSKANLDFEFEEYNRKLNEGKDGYGDLQFYGTLRKEIFCYSLPIDIGSIQLNNHSFTTLLDLYSQLGYLAYLCYCRKFKLKDDFVVTAMAENLHPI